ncbi:unnamed protein product [Arctogadus glacialis]
MDGTWQPKADRNSYCLDCITGLWDNEEDVYSCPQCRQTFEPRPALVKNTVLADVLEDLKRTQLRDAPPDHYYAGPKDVGCDVCAGRKMKAIKSCLGCQASFCEEHLQGHYQVSGLKRHKLVEPTADLQDNICPRHDELIRMFCCQEQQSICCVCAVYEHRNHDMISVEAERNKKQQDLSRHQKNTRTIIQEVEEDLKLLQRNMVAINPTFYEASRDVDILFNGMIRHLEGQRSDIKEKIRTNQDATVSRLQDLQKKLKQEIVDMKRSEANLQQLSHIQSHVTFLKKYPQNLRLKQYQSLSNRDILPMQFLQKLTGALTKKKEELEVFLSGTIRYILQAGTQEDVKHSRDHLSHSLLTHDAVPEYYKQGGGHFFINPLRNQVYGDY